MFSGTHQLSSNILFKAHIGGTWFSANHTSCKLNTTSKGPLNLAKHYKVKTFTTLYMGFLFYCKIWALRDLENIVWTNFVIQENCSEEGKVLSLKKIKLQEKLDQRKWEAKMKEQMWNSKRGIVSVSAPLSSLFTSQQVIPAWEAIREITKFSKSGANWCTEIFYPGRISRCTFNGKTWALREISQP